MVKKPEPKTPRQIEKFRDLAREIGADEDEAAFKAKLVKIAKAPRVGKVSTSKGDGNGSA